MGERSLGAGPHPRLYIPYARPYTLSMRLLLVEEFTMILVHTTVTVIIPL
jgi:hypothetical protein